MSSLGEPKFTQENRFLKVETGLGTDVFFLKSVSGHESFSQLFEFHLELLSYEPDINALDIVGDNVSFAIDINSETPKYANGYVANFEFTGIVNRELYGYRATLVPWFWFLKKRVNYRVFQNLSVKEIFEEICGELGYQDFRWSLNEDHPKLEYCVQYGESDFDFLNRLLESEGIFYFFMLDSGKHTLCLVDAITAYENLDPKELEHTSGSSNDECIRSWRHQYQYLSGKWSQSDFNFEKFNHSLLTESSSVLKIKNSSSFSVYEYPGLYAENDRGKALTKLRMEAEESQFDIIGGSSDVKSVALAKKFSYLSDENKLDHNKQFVFTAIVHEAKDTSFVQDEEEEESYYKNTFSCLPVDAPYRPPLKTPSPRIEGVQTAVVVGKSGDEIYTDEYGRIKIQFHWDLYGQKDENSSCWVRVATQWAGKKWGAIGIPRVGQEVVVTFVNGDPDRPLVIGSVYNSAHMPPFDLPGDKNVRGVKSRSTKGGDRGTYNEISFDDTMGSEKLTIHAQKDFNMDVGKDAGTNAAGNATNNVDGNVTSTIGGNQSASVGGDDSTSVSGNQSNTISGNKTDSVSGNQDATVGGDDSTNVSGKQSVSTGSNQDITVGASQTQSISSNQEISVGANQTISVGATQDISATNQNVSISANASMSATQISISGNAKIDLAVAGSSVSITPAGVTISFGASSVAVNAAGVQISGPIIKLN